MVGAVNDQAATVAQNGIGPSANATRQSEPSGFAELKQSMRALESSVKNQLSIPKESNSPVPPDKSLVNGDDSASPEAAASSGIQVQYQLAARFSLLLKTDWEVLPGFKLKGIMLRMAAEVSDEPQSAALQILLEAYATIGDFEFTVSAELPNLQSGRDVNIVFTMTIRRPAVPDELTGALAQLSGGGDSVKSTVLADDSLKKALSKDSMFASLQVRVTKPAGEGKSFSFSSLFCRFYAEIKWKTRIDSLDLDIEVFDCDFILALLKDPVDPDVPLQIVARLYGTMYIGNTGIDAAIDFTRDAEAKNRISFQVRAVPNLLSAMDFLKELPAAKKNTGGGAAATGSGDELISDLDLPGSLGSFQDSLEGPQLELQLSGSWYDGKLEMLLFEAYASRLDKFALPFLDKVRLKNLALQIEFKEVRVALAGTLIFNKYIVQAQIVFIKDKGLHLTGVLESRSNCSLATLARMDVFNDKSQADGKSMDIAGFAKGVKTGGNAPVELDGGSNTVGGDTKVSFELIVEKKTPPKEAEDKDPEKAEAGGDNASKTLQNGGNTITDTSVKKQQQQQQQKGGGYEIQHIKFLSHFNLDWQIVENTIVFQNMGICFDVVNPREKDKRVVSGLIYGTWRLSSVELFAYVVGRKDAKATEFWAGLNVKKKTGSSASSKALDIIKDSKFTDTADGSTSDLTLPLKLPSDMQAKPNEAEIAEGLNFDGRLLVHFAKNAVTEKSYKIKEVSLYVNLAGTFSVADYKMAGQAMLDVRVIKPTDKTKRDFACFFKGVLQFENGIFLQLEGDIPMNKKKPEVSDAAPKSDAAPTADAASKESDPTKEGDASKEGSATAKAQRKAIETRMGLKMTARTGAETKDLVAEDKEGEDDMVFLVRVGKRPPPIPGSPTAITDAHDSREASLSKNSLVAHEASFKEVVAASSKKSDTETETQINNSIPPGNPIGNRQGGINFSAALVLAREDVEGGGSRRRLKSLAVSLTSTERWDIIQDKVWVESVGLSAVMKWVKGQDKASYSGILQGVIRIGTAAAVSGQVTYDSGTKLLTLVLVASIDLSQILGNLGTEEAAQPMLTDDITKKGTLLAGVGLTLKDMKLDAYKVTVLALADLKITDSLVLQQIGFDIESKGRTTNKPTTELTIDGELSVLRDGKPTVDIDMALKSTNKDLTITIKAQKLSPATVANGVAKGSLGGDNQPELPASTGFSDWSVDKQPSETTFSTSGTVIFTKDSGSGKRRFSKAELAVSLMSGEKKSWDIIGEYLQLKNLVFVLAVEAGAKESDSKTVSVSLRALLVFAKRPSKSTPAASVPLTLKYKSKSTVSLSVEFGPDRTLGDVLYGVTGGLVDIPEDFDPPLFKKLVLSYDWKKSTGSAEAFFVGEEGSWKAPVVDVFEILGPKLVATFEKGGKNSKRASIKGLFKAFDTIRLNVEFVLFKGPLLIEDIDVVEVARWVKRIYNLIKTIGNIAKTAYEIGEFIGWLMGVAGTAVLGFFGGVAAWMLNGILGGKDWDEARKEARKAIKEAAGPDKDWDEDEVLRGFGGGVAPFEGQPSDADNTRGTDMNHDSDNPVVPISLPDVEDLEKRLYLSTDYYIRVSGSGTSAGPPGEAVEFILEYKDTGRSKLAKALASHILREGAFPELEGPANFEVTGAADGKTNAKNAGISKTLEKMTLGKRYRVAWNRPSDLKEDLIYTITLTVPTKSPSTDAPKTMSWRVSVKIASTDVPSPTKPKWDIISPWKTDVRTKDPLKAGDQVVGYVFIRDSEGNVRQGLDDRDSISAAMYRLPERASEMAVKLTRRENGYIIHAVEPLTEGSYELLVWFGDLEGRCFRVKVTNPTRLGSIWVGGSGLCSGPPGEKAVSVLLQDPLGAIAEKDVVKATLSINTDKRDISLKRKRGKITSYGGQFDRPTEAYTISITVNDAAVPGSPFMPLLKSDRVTIDLPSSILSVPKPTLTAGESQRLTIQLFDNFRSRWFGENTDYDDPLQGWRLQAKSAGQPTLSWNFLRPSKTPSPPGQRHINITTPLSSHGTYALSLTKPAADASSPAPDLPLSLSPAGPGQPGAAAALTITTPTVPAYTLTGDGLAAGYEGTRTSVAVRARDQAASVSDERVKLRGAVFGLPGAGNSGGALEALSDLEFRDGAAVYVRPAALGKGKPREYVVRVWARERRRKGDSGDQEDVEVEVGGSPALVRAVYFFDEIEVVSRSFWLAEAVVSAGAAAGGKEVKKAVLVLRDQFGGVVKSGAVVVVVDSKGYAAQKVAYLDDQSVFELTYTLSASSVPLQLYIDGLKVEQPVLPRLTWSAPGASQSKALAAQNVEQQVASLLLGTGSTASDVAADEIQVDVFSQSSAEYSRAKIVATPGVAGKWDIKGVFATAGRYVLRPTYRGLPLAGLPGGGDGNADPSGGMSTNKTGDVDYSVVVDVNKS